MRSAPRLDFGALVARILACIDASSYANSVCDHAGWFASDPDIGVEVLHVASPASAGVPLALATAGDALIDRAVRRLQEEGVGPISSAHLSGSLTAVATQRDAEVIVMGKRGDTTESERRRLGSNVDAMIRATETPVCLTSKLFLPIRRGLVLLDADMSHRGAIDFAVSEPRLADLPMDVVVMSSPGEDPEPKVEWARTALNSEGGDVFTLEANELNDAVTKYMESRAADLMVVSRAVITRDPEANLSRIEDRGLWGARTPVLIC
jgi:nucleotide-binding universal stress UspA family protein